MAGRSTVDSTQCLRIRDLMVHGPPAPELIVEWFVPGNGRSRWPLQIGLGQDMVTLRLMDAATSTLRPGPGQVLGLVATPCNFGGVRYWFVCSGCARHVAAIYRRATIFACRKCSSLGYGSQLERQDLRAFRRADRLRERLCWVRGVFNGRGTKPKGMRWKTFTRLLNEYQRFERASLAGISSGVARANLVVDQMLKR